MFPPDAERWPFPCVDGTTARVFDAEVAPMKPVEEYPPEDDDPEAYNADCSTLRFLFSASPSLLRDVHVVSPKCRLGRWFPIPPDPVYEEIQGTEASDPD